MKYPILFLLSSCAVINEFPDNFVEEEVEQVIQQETGISIDFTGNSPEAYIPFSLFQF